MERTPFAILILLPLVLGPHVVAGHRSSSSYKAGVFQHVDPSDPQRTLDDVMRQSVATYEQWTRTASSLGVEILVFPEYGVTGVSVPSERSSMRPYLQVLPGIELGPEPWNPCLESDDATFNTTILRSLSCVARDNGLVLVVNIPTLVRCSATDDPSCPSDGGYQFNTDVALDANGTVMATYHKMNLYHEPAFDPPPYPSDHVTVFETDFATFGLLTCFDLLWHDPTVALVAERGVRHLVMPTAWIDGLPFLISVQSQMAWAIGLDVALLAANVQNSQDGYRGSGIYDGRRGYLSYVYGPYDVDRLIVADVPSSENGTAAVTTTVAEAPFFNYSGIIYDDLSNYTFVALNASRKTGRQGSATLTHGNLTCALEYAFEETVDDGDYFLAGYEGRVTLGDGDYRLAVQTCALLWCQDADVTLCVHPPVTSHARLVALQLVGRFDTAYVYPSLLRHDALLVDTSEWSFVTNVTNSGGAAVEMRTEPGFSHRPLVAALYGRLYDLDG